MPSDNLNQKVGVCLPVGAKNLADWISRDALPAKGPILLFTYHSPSAEQRSLKQTVQAIGRTPVREGR